MSHPPRDILFLLMSNGSIDMYFLLSRSLCVSLMARTRLLTDSTSSYPLSLRVSLPRLVPRLKILSCAAYIASYARTMHASTIIHTPPSILGGGAGERARGKIAQQPNLCHAYSRDLTNRAYHNHMIQTAPIFLFDSTHTTPTRVILQTAPILIT